jgi:hypothetical protein
MTMVHKTIQLMDRILIIRYHSSFGGYVKNADLFADFRLLYDRKPLSKITGNIMS